MTNPVIIDTDPGLDDAIAILFALGSGRFDVLGLTTVAGNIGLDRTTANAAGLLAVMQRPDIPVVAGMDRPLERWALDLVGLINGDDGMKGVALPAPLTPPQADAVGWMARQLEAAAPGGIDILALGPLTNIAQLLRAHPGLAGRIGRVIAMGGTLHEAGNAGPNSEFNFASDPDSLVEVLRSQVPVTIVPLDVTRKVRADADYIAGLRGTAHGDLAAEILNAYLQDASRVSRPLHDPCVMLLALDPGAFDIRTMTLAVDQSASADAGAIYAHAQGWTADIALGVDAARALALLRTGFA